jgi:hypothetical protein
VGKSPSDQFLQLTLINGAIEKTLGLILFRRIIAASREICQGIKLLNNLLDKCLSHVVFKVLESKALKNFLGISKIYEFCAIAISYGAIIRGFSWLETHK